VDDAEKVMEVVVEDKQLSLAIGKKGQNVRLAAKLTGWKIDIKSEEEKRKEVEALLGALEVGDLPADESGVEGDGPVEPEPESPADAEIQAADQGGESPVDAEARAAAEPAAVLADETDGK
jgi:transcription antitermination factor NusA-like protein